MKRLSHFAVIAGLFLTVASAARAAESALPTDEVRALAREAYVFGYPLVENYRTLFFYAVDQSSPEYKGPFNTFVHRGRSYAPQDSVPSPNNDTVSSFAWLDLRAEPIVLTVPKIDKARYFSLTLVDLYTFNFASIGTRLGGNAGGNFLITGPRWKGKTPGGIRLTYPCETDFAMAVVRNQLFGPGDFANLNRIQEGFTIRPLSQFLKKPAPPRAPSALFPTFSRSRADSVDFIRYLNFVLQFCKGHPSETPFLARLAKIGVGAGKPFDWQTLPPEMMIAMEAGIGDAIAECDVARTNLRTLYNLFGSRAVMKNNYFNRFLGARIGLYTPDWEETLFLTAGTDNTGRPLEGKGGNRYVMRFEPGQLPPVNAFWSLTLYDTKKNSFSANLYNRYSINSSILPAPVAEADGGVTFYFQHDPPAREVGANWLPAPDGPFYVTLRLYWPKPAALEGKWTMPEVKRAVDPVVPVKEVPFDPPFVKEATASSAPASVFPIAPPPAAIPFVREPGTASTPPVPPAAPAPIPLPRTPSSLPPPFVKGSSPAPEPQVPVDIPVRAALPVEKKATPIPTPRVIATPGLYHPPFVSEPAAR